MKNKKRKIFNSINKYRFELKHLIIVLLILSAFQVSFSVVNKISLKNFSEDVHEWYKRDSAEKFAGITATSIELIVETIKTKQELTEEDKLKIIQAFNVILSPQSLQQRIKEILLLVEKNGKIYSIKEAEALYSYLYDNVYPVKDNTVADKKAINIYEKCKTEIITTGRIKSIFEDGNIFHIYVPFIIRGENIGALYVKYIPDFSAITENISAGYEDISFIYSILVFFGFLAMYFITSNTIKERDETQKLLFEEHEEYLKEKIIHQNEALFTKRIYHTHHKAEKIMGFIKNDITKLPQNNETHKIMKYANFISRVIYDMKWYEPPINTIRNPIFRTDLNEVIKFLRKNIFLRTDTVFEVFKIELELDLNFPLVAVNEFVIWEIIEPLIQNSIDHSQAEKLIIKIKTIFDDEEKKSRIIIEDNGKGIPEKLLEKDKQGIQKLFHENVTTKDTKGRNRGYGCYLAYTIAAERCGWNLEAENLSLGGAIFIISFKN